MNHKYFLDISPETAADPTAPFVVLPLPYERTVSFGSGTALGPSAILNASHEVEDFDEELKVKMDYQVQTLPEPDLQADSDSLALAEIKKTALSHMQNSRFILSLGGEHTVTAPLAAAAAECFNNLSVLHLDAHLDLRESYQDNPLSHACVMKRVRDMGQPTVHCGIRSCSAEEFKYTEDNNVPVFWAEDIHSCSDNSWISPIIDQLTENVYLTVDIDIFDPALVPGTGTPEPGGLDWRQVTGLIRRVIREKNVIAADIVELAPISGTNVSEFIAARLGAKIIAYKTNMPS